MYIVEGNIGVGKTTFLSIINENCPEITVVEEPKDNWTSQVKGQSLLANFYADIKRWAYTMETWAMICRVNYHMEAQKDPNPNRIMERSIYSGHYCFALNDYENGFLSDTEWHVYSKWVDILIHNKCRPPKGFIYLQSTPETCYRRVQIRNRCSESNLTLDYLKQIHKYHERFLIQKDLLTTELNCVPVLILDCDEEFEHNHSKKHDIIKKVKDFIEK